MRLIDAVSTAELIAEKFNIKLSELVDVFAEIPTADAVPVVRCKDCKHYTMRTATYMDKDEEVTERWCRHCGWHKENHYCADGERKEET